MRPQAPALRVYACIEQLFSRNVLGGNSFPQCAAGAPETILGGVQTSVLYCNSCVLM